MSASFRLLSNRWLLPLRCRTDRVVKGKPREDADIVHDPRVRRQSIGFWTGGFLAGAVLARLSLIQQLDRSLSHTLAAIGTAWPALNLVWVFAGFPLTVLLVGLRWLSRQPRHRWPMLGAFLGGTLVEVLFKHGLVTPFPHPTPEPFIYRQLENWTNITPELIRHWLGGGGPAGTPIVHHWFVGSYPSGHTFRGTYTLGVLWPRRPAVRRLGALVIGFAVLATGGHWAIDAVGGWLLAELCLTVNDLGIPPVR